MAKATATCTCKECRLSFTKSVNKPNRREADSWETWAVANFTQCPACRRAAQQAKESAEPVTLNMGFDASGKNVILYFTGNTMPHKNTIAAAGYQYGVVPQSSWHGMLTVGDTKGWYKTASLEDVGAEESLVVSIGAKAVSHITAVELTAYQQAKENETHKESEIAKLQKPTVPAVLNGKKWNQKVYGRRGNYSVYPDSIKTEITDEEAAEIETYLKSKAAYKKAVSEINA